jgi:hypothetical protein
MIKPTGIFCCAVYAATSSVALAGAGGVYDSANVLLGEYAERDGSIPVIHSVHGYRFEVDGTTGAVTGTGLTVDIVGATFVTSPLLYSSSGCSGQAYVAVNNQSSGLSGGLVFSAGNKGLYYVAKTPSVTQTAMASSYNGSACNNFAPMLFQVVPAAPNDPATTGVPSAPFTPPLRLEMVPLSQFFRIFRSGFEATWTVGFHEWWEVAA